MRVPAVLIILILIISGSATAQEKSDTTRLKKVVDNIKDSKVTKQIAESLKQNPSDETPQKSEELFMPFEGRIIRKIIIEPIDFEKNVTDDTSKHIANRIAKIGNALHNNSRIWMLRD